MKENKNTPAKESFSFVGTQYLAWALSMLLVFTGITPAQAAGGKSKTFQLMLQARKGQPLSMELNAKLERQLRVATMGKTPLHLKINGQEFTLNPTNAVALTGKQPARPTADLSAAPLQAQALANANVDLAALFTQIDRAQQLLKLDDPEAQKDAFALLLPLVKQAQEMLRQAQVPSREFLPYFENVNVFLENAEHVLSTPEPTAGDLQPLYQWGRDAFDSFFSGTNVHTDREKLEETLYLLEGVSLELEKIKIDRRYLVAIVAALVIASVLLYIEGIAEEKE